MTTVNFKRLTETAILPTKGTEYSAGFDLHADIKNENITIAPHNTILIGTGFSVEIPIGFFGGIFARSGISTKRGIRPANCVGVIDAKR